MALRQDVFEASSVPLSSAIYVDALYRFVVEVFLASGDHRAFVCPAAFEDVFLSPSPLRGRGGSGLSFA